MTHPQPPAQQQPKESPFSDLAYATGRWEIFRQDAGMGEKDYCVLRNGEFFCRTEHLDVAKDICASYDKHRSRPHPAPAPIDDKPRCKFVGGQCIFIMQTDRDAIARKAREDERIVTLLAVIEKANQETARPITPAIVRGWCESLRQPTEQERPR